MQLATLGLIVATVVVGALVPLQSGVNATIARYYGNPVMAALTNTVVASMALIAVLLVLRPSLPPVARVLSAPWYAWCGGLIGACLVFAGLYIAPRIGAAAFLAAMLMGTMAASLLVDHFGLLEFREQPVTALRLLGAALVVAGMLILQAQPR